MDDPFLQNVFSKEIFGVRIVNLISKAYIYRLHYVSFSTNLNKFSRASGVLFHFELSIKTNQHGQVKIYVTNGRKEGIFFNLFNFEKEFFALNVYQYICSISSLTPLLFVVLSKNLK